MDANPKVEQGVQTHILDSWQQFHDLVATDLANAPAYIFRGQADAKWPIDSTLDRLERRFPTRRNFQGGTPEVFNCPPASRQIHLEAFRRSMLGRRGNSPLSLKDNEVWALAQHHGLATPMLDWTLSPFVALFFAFEEGKLCDNQKGILYEPEERVVYALSQHLVGENSPKTDPPPVPFSPATETSHRLSGCSKISCPFRIHFFCGRAV